MKPGSEHLPAGNGHELPALLVAPPGRASLAASARLAAVECPAFGHRRTAVAFGPLVLAAGRGSNVWDVDGNRYVDLAAGFGAVLLGHGHPAVAAAVASQSARLVQGLGDVFASDAKLALLERLAAIHPKGPAQVLLAQSGSGAVTAALKTAALSTGRPGVIAFDGAYHGLGYGPLAACGFRSSLRLPFAAQLNPHTRFVPYPGVRGARLGACLDQLSAELRAGDVGAVLVEPVMGRGGCVVPPPEFLAELCALAHRYGALVVADEIWTGLGRAGALSRALALGAPVDILCLGKGLGGGLPISACVAPMPIMEAWVRTPGVVHTSTHAGAPLACAAALATLDALEAGALAARAEHLGQTFVARFRAALRGCPLVEEVRGVGMMIGIELADGGLAFRAAAALLGRGYLVLPGGVAGDTLTITPALTIAEAQLEAFGETLREVLDSLQTTAAGSAG